eukprot:jgi/Bigna1/146861/aug1.122_g21569
MVMNSLPIDKIGIMGIMNDGDSLQGAKTATVEEPEVAGETEPAAKSTGKDKDDNDGPEVVDAEVVS